MTTDSVSVECAALFKSLLFAVSVVNIGPGPIDYIGNIEAGTLGEKTIFMQFKKEAGCFWNSYTPW
jgi:hypothetical protein